MPIIIAKNIVSPLEKKLNITHCENRFTEDAINAKKVYLRKIIYIKQLQKLEAKNQLLFGDTCH